ncbi:rCG46734, isoform CRA_a [Rattus norvegicus]|uniref:RCG46734, isoform CRA_a n=1 Tax=Rattus norvegicus TaxID=10116 RepID=A6IXT0_RAT|nr:rCG46734, isoform CRA_a [Rattus norvegicus]
MGSTTQRRALIARSSLCGAGTGPSSSQWITTLFSCC